MALRALDKLKENEKFICFRTLKSESLDTVSVSANCHENMRICDNSWRYPLRFAKRCHVLRRQQRGARTFRRGLLFLPFTEDVLLQARCSRSTRPPSLVRLRGALSRRRTKKSRISSTGNVTVHATAMSLAPKCQKSDVP